MAANKKEQTIRIPYVLSSPNEFLNNITVALKVLYRCTMIIIIPHLWY